MIIKGAVGKIQDPGYVLNKLRVISEKNKIEIQILDANSVFGKNHILSAFKHALRAFKENRNSMRKFSMEFTLYLAGERQIKDAIRKTGISEETEKFVVVFFCQEDWKDIEGSIGEEEADKIIKEIGLNPVNNIFDDIDIAKLKRFGFTDEEINTVGKDKYEDLVLEKVSMLDVMK